MRKMTDWAKGKVADYKDWKEGIPPEYREEARDLRKSIADLQSRIDSIGKILQPQSHLAHRDDLYGGEMVVQTPPPADLSPDHFSRLNEEAALLIADRNQKSAALEALRTKSKRKNKGESKTEPSIGERMNRYAAGVDRIKNALNPVFAAINEVSSEEEKALAKKALANVRNALSSMSTTQTEMQKGAEFLETDAHAQAHVLSKMKEWLSMPLPEGEGLPEERVAPLIRAIADTLKKNNQQQ